jgi:DNA-binding XRE family transcriptional regulator
MIIPGARIPRAYSRYSAEAVSLLGRLIRLHRVERRMSAKDLADRAGISRTTLRKIESGDMKCEIGLVFEVAVLVGVPLFTNASLTLHDLREHIEAKIALLPQSVRLGSGEVHDDF